MYPFVCTSVRLSRAVARKRRVLALRLLKNIIGHPVLEVEFTGQRGRMANRSGQNVLETENNKLHRQYHGNQARSRLAYY